MKRKYYVLSRMEEAGWVSVFCTRSKKRAHETFLEFLDRGIVARVVTRFL